MHADFQASGHHPERIMHAVLIVENKFLRQQVQNLAVGGRARSGLYRRPGEFLRGQFRATRVAKNNAAMTVHAAHVRAGNAKDGVLDRNSRDIFGQFDGLLNVPTAFSRSTMTPLREPRDWLMP